MKNAILLAIVCLVICGCEDKEARQKNAELETQIAAKDAELKKCEATTSAAAKIETELRAQLAASVAAATELKSKLDAAIADVARLAPDAKRGRTLPLKITTRKALLENGYVLTMKNTASEILPVTVTFKRGTRTKAFDRTLPAAPYGAAVEIGGAEGWDAAPGDVATIEAEGYDPMSQKF